MLRSAVERQFEILGEALNQQFHTLLEVQVLAEDWSTEHNTYRPHGSLHWFTPQAFHQQWITNRQPAPS